MTEVNREMVFIVKMEDGKIKAMFPRMGFINYTKITREKFFSPDFILPDEDKPSGEVVT